MDQNQKPDLHPRPAIEFSCCRCARVVRICQCCWRNQKYCSPECSHQATLERHRRNQKAYRMTAAGRDHHKTQQQTYRARKKIKIKSDRSTIIVVNPAKPPLEKG